MTATLLYLRASARVLRRGRRSSGRAGTREERLVFVVGAPRSGTTFLGGAIGAAPGFVDLGEVLPLKSAIPELVREDPDVAAEKIRHVLERVRRLGFAATLRGVEQTPEMSFLVVPALRAYPHARCVHIVRDGRDVVSSLLERSWLSARPGWDADDVGGSYGAHVRFWVEPGRERDFTAASDARRAAWAWRRYVSAARSAAAPVFEIRYEELAANPARVAGELAAQLDVEPGDLAEPLSHVHERSVGRYRRDLTPEQLADVEAEAGGLLEELGYL